MLHSRTRCYNCHCVANWDFTNCPNPLALVVMKKEEGIRLGRLDTPLCYITFWPVQILLYSMMDHLNPCAHMHMHNPPPTLPHGLSLTCVGLLLKFYRQNFDRHSARLPSLNFHDINIKISSGFSTNHISLISHNAILPH